MRIVRTLGAAVAASVLLALLSSAAVLAMAAGADPSVKLVPANRYGMPIDYPGYYRVTAPAGTRQRLWALVGNNGRVPATVSLVPVDATDAVYGGISYDLPQQHRRSVGNWVSLSRTEVHLSPGGNKLVRFTVHVPRGAAVGQHIGGLTAYVPAHSSKAHSFGALWLQLRTVAAIEVTVPGPTRSGLTLAPLSTKYEPTGLYADLPIRNTGDTLMKARGHLLVQRVGGTRPILNHRFLVDTTVPGVTLSYPAPWPGRPKPGAYRYSASLRWNGGKTAESGVFKFGSPPVAPPGRPVVGGPLPTPSPSPIPLHLIMTIGALLGLVGAGVAIGTLGVPALRRRFSGVM